MTEWSISRRTYRRLDTGSKLLGLALVAVALEIGGDSPTGLALAVVGAMCATATVFINNE